MLRGQESQLLQARHGLRVAQLLRLRLTSACQGSAMARAQELVSRPLANGAQASTVTFSSLQALRRPLLSGKRRSNENSISLKTKGTPRSCLSSLKRFKRSIMHARAQETVHLVQLCLIKVRDADVAYKSPGKRS